MDGNRAFTDPRFSIARILLAPLFIVTAFVATQVSGEDRRHFNLPSAPFPKAILEFYHQSRIEVIFRTRGNLKNVHTQPVTCECTPAEALERMLAWTPLAFAFDSENSVVIIGADSLQPGDTPFSETPRLRGASSLFSFVEF
jgi:hypothetical protein